jgi:hypothetical protein
MRGGNRREQWFAEGGENVEGLRDWGGGGGVLRQETCLIFKNIETKKKKKKNKKKNTNKHTYKQTKKKKNTKIQT